MNNEEKIAHIGDYIIGWDCSDGRDKGVYIVSKKVDSVTHVMETGEILDSETIRNIMIKYAFIVEEEWNEKDKLNYFSKYVEELNTKPSLDTSWLDKTINNLELQSKGELKMTERQKTIEVIHAYEYGITIQIQLNDEYIYERFWDDVDEGHIFNFIKFIYRIKPEPTLTKELKMTETQKKIEVMQAHEDGKNIEMQHLGLGFWMGITNPLWNWDKTIYRVKQIKIPLTAEDMTPTTWIRWNEHPVPLHIKQFDDESLWINNQPYYSYRELMEDIWQISTSPDRFEWRGAWKYDK